MGKLNKSLGIVTPTLNSGKYFEQTVLSLTSLIEAGGEYLVVDSGSIDSTLEICDAKKVSSIYCPPGNMYQAVNAGLDSLSTDWLTYINSDDLLYSDAISLALLEYGNDADIIYGDTDYIDSSGRFLFSKRAPPPCLLKGIFQSGIMPFAQPGTLFKKSLFNELHGFSEHYKYCSDYDFFLSASMLNIKFCHFNKASISAFRIHDQQYSAVFREQMKNETEIVLSSHGFTRPRSVVNFSKGLHRVMNIDTHLVKYLRLFSVNDNS